MKTRLRRFLQNRDVERRNRETLFWKTSKSHDILHGLPKTLNSISNKNVDNKWATKKAPDVWAQVYAASLDSGQDPALVADEAVREYLKRVHSNS